jgi:prepilin-type N-terminal cleavage/methylation domain-containing protein
MVVFRGTRAGARSGRQGFTLVELLVVIGIIALLISILMPALGKARAAANKTRCLSNLHQIGIFLQQYQTQYKGVVPIYTLGDSAVLSYFAYSDRDKCYTGLGLLVPAHIIKGEGGTGDADGRVFYDPVTETQYPSNWFNHMEPGAPWNCNPWCGGPEMPGMNTRLTFSLRPDYYSHWGAPGQRYACFPTARNDMINTTDTSRVYILPDIENRPCFPHARDFSNANSSALVMDLNSTVANRNAVHKGGVCALYNDWSAKLIPIDYIRQYINRINLEEATASPYTEKARFAHFEMWKAMDHF